MQFTEFPKMPRLAREMIITEKLDGTNACIFIKEYDPCDAFDAGYALAQDNGMSLFAGSRTRWIRPEDDNYGFAKWCQKNSEDLFGLGVGRHFGEWWGQGIQRGYGLGEKRFSLFNTVRWGDHPDALVRPACCHVVPVLKIGKFDTYSADCTLVDLAKNGSAAAPGFMRPEGIVVFHCAANMGFKRTIEKDDQPKSVSGV